MINSHTPNINTDFVHCLFEEAAKTHPSAIAVVFDDQCITYEELNSRADDLAQAILHYASDKELIGLSTSRSIEMVISILGILKAGKSYVPLDSSYPENRLRQIKEDSGIEICICIDADRTAFTKLGLTTINSDISYSFSPVAKSSQNLNCCILYTSGSTGKPKGVCIGHAGLVNFLNYQKVSGLTGLGVRALQFSHLSFDASLQEILVPLTTGSTLHLLSDNYRLDAARLLDYIIDNQINKAFFPYVTLQYLTEAACAEQRFPLDLKEVTTGGELIKVTPTIRTFFSAIADCVLRNAYGPTETTIWVTENKLSGSPGSWPDLPSIGKPIGSSIFFLDGKLELIEDETIGELCVSGVCLANGYLHQPEMTAEKFINWMHPVLGEIKLYRTGDLGRFLSDGNIEFAGRKDNQVKIRGNRIELAEIEIAILKNKNIQQAVVIVREDLPARKAIVAYLVGDEKAYPVNLLRELIANLLPDYMIPSGFVWLSELPETTSGKINHKALPKPDSKRPAINTLYKRPENEVEKNVAAAFANVLQIDKIGVNDNFFELGGNSLLAQKTIAELKYSFNINLPITKLYQYPTVAKIVKFLNRKIIAPDNNNEKGHLNLSTDIAVIGMACRFPGANDINSFWQLLTEGRETTAFFSQEKLDSCIPESISNDLFYVKARGIVDGADHFDAAFFNINPKLADLMDPQQRLFLEIAWEVLEKTGHLPAKYQHKIGVFAGSGTNTYYENNVLRHPDLIDNQGKMQVTSVNDKDFIASRTAYHLNLTGPAISVNSACSTSLLAVTLAVNSLRSGQCDAALAGGSSVTSPIHSGHIYQEGSMLSRDGHCKPFDDNATGTVFSDGAGIVLLKRLSDAQRDGDKIYGVIKGVGANNDGYEKGSFTAPSAEGQSDAISMAIYDSGIEASEISMIEAHGTGTPIGDPIEFEGLVNAFGDQPKKQFCAIGSVKSNFGHLTQAAGVAGLMKTCLALHYKKIPASLGFEKPNRNIDFVNSPFYVNHQLSEWKANKNRVAGVSSFGVGGTNVHVIVEEYKNAPFVSTEGRPHSLICISAQSETSLDRYSDALSNFARKNGDVTIADIAYTLNKTRIDFSHRRFIIAQNTGELSVLLTKGITAQQVSLKEVGGEIAFTFPGQGAQYINMGIDLYKNEPVYTNAVDECAELLLEYLDTDIREIIFPAEIKEQSDRLLKETKFTQPALFVTEYALAKLWMSWGIVPSILCGHSVGEYVAAHLSGIFSLADGLKLIATRGALVNDLPGGSMISVRLEAAILEEMLVEGLSIAAINSPKLCVVAGPEEKIALLSNQLDKLDIPNKLLATSHAFHSSMMDPVIGEFKNIVASVKLSIPKIQVVSTVSGKTLSNEEAVDPDYWANHLRNTVRFSEAIQYILAMDEQFVFLETGPGNVNTTLIRQIGNAYATKAFQSISTRENDFVSILDTLGQLWNNGLFIDWNKFYISQKRLIIDDLPTYQFDTKKHWVDGIGTNIHSRAVVETASETEKKKINNTINTHYMRMNILQVKIKKVLEDASGIDIADHDSGRNFIELGFDSLLLTQVAISLKKEFNLPITFRKLNEEYPTIDSLTDYVSQHSVHQEIEGPAAKQLANATHPVQVPFQNNAPAGSFQASDSALGLIAQQLEILSKQVSLMYGSDTVKNGFQNITASLNQPQIPKSEESASEAIKDLTLQERKEIQKPFGATPQIDRNASELTTEQQGFLKKLISRYNEKTSKSKQYASESRSYMADPRVVNGFRPKTKELVYPIVINRSEGSRMWDIDGNEYIDVLNGFGSNMLGYQPEVIKKAMHEQVDKGYEVGPQHELAAEVSKLICEFTGFDRSALCSTGSEAVLGCIRIARTVTGRSLIVSFTGSYHGIIDEVLVRGTKKLKSFPAAAGIMPEAVHNIMVLDYGTDEALEIIKSRADEIAAVIVEPIQSRRPEFVPVDFLKELRNITRSSGSVLIFDEVITGFRLHPGGAQALFGIKADLASYGKVVGGGLPIGVIAGKKEYMDALDGGNWQFGDDSFPEVGVTYFAGTFVRHPLALAAAKASLLYLKEKGAALQESLNIKGDYLSSTVNREIEKRKLPFFVANFGSLWKVKFNEEVPYSELMFILMREKGIHIIDGFPCFITEATSDTDIEQIIKCFVESMDEMINIGFFIKEDGFPKSQDKSDIAISLKHPPVEGARLGKDKNGNPAWFIKDEQNAGKYLQIQL